VLRIDGTDIVAGVIQGSDFVGDGGVAFAGIELLEITRIMSRSDLHFQHVNRRGAESISLGWRLKRVGDVAARLVGEGPGCM